MPKKINELSAFPQIEVALNNWQQTITLVRVLQRIVDGVASNTTVETQFKGTIQPLSPQQLSLKPEGDRAWKWYQIHAYTSDLDLKPNSIVKFNDISYKIMAVFDYSLNNFISYHAILDYEST